MNFKVQKFAKFGLKLFQIISPKCNPNVLFYFPSSFFSNSFYVTSSSSSPTTTYSHYVKFRNHYWSHPLLVNLLHTLVSLVHQPPSHYPPPTMCGKTLVWCRNLTRKLTTPIFLLTHFWEVFGDGKGPSPYFSIP